MHVQQHQQQCKFAVPTVVPGSSITDKQKDVERKRVRGVIDMSSEKCTGSINIGKCKQADCSYRSSDGGAVQALY